MSGREAPEIGSTDPGAPWKDGVTPSTSNGLAAFPCAWATMASSRAKSKTPGAVSRFGQYTMLVVRSKAPTEAAGNVVPSSGACMPKNREVTAVPWLVVISRLVDVPCAGAAPVATAPPVGRPLPGRRPRAPPPSGAGHESQDHRSRHRGRRHTEARHRA